HLIKSQSKGITRTGSACLSSHEELLYYNPQMSAKEAIHNHSDAIPIMRANGNTTVAATPSGGILGGQVAVMDLDGYTWEESTVGASVGVTFQLPRIDGGGRGGGGGSGGPGTDRPYVDRKKARDEKL